MNFINPNHDHPQFINDIKSNNQPIQLNLNQYNQNSQTNRSLTFTFFNHNSIKFPLQTNQNQPQNLLKQQDNPDISLSIGFNKNLQNFFQNSLNFPNQEDFKNANIKKTPTFLFTQGFLNQTHHQSSEIKCENQEIENIHQKKHMKNKNKQNLIKSGSNTDKEIIKTQNQNQMKHQHQQQPHQQKQKEQPQANEKISQHLFLGESNLQNLKAIAKVAFQGIKRQKIATYRSISNLMLSGVNQSQNSQQNNFYNRISHCSSFQNQDRKSEIIENMIRAKSFKGVELMGQIQQEDQLSYDSGSRKHGNSFQEGGNYPRQKQSSVSNIKNLKNIRRRLYDAINVMIAANILQKRENGQLTLKSTNTKQIYNKSITINTQSNQMNEESCSFEQMEKKYYEKRKQVEAKRKYKELLATKYLTLQKHVNKNKMLQRRSTHQNEKKLYFPLIFVSAQLPMKINFMEMAQTLQIESQEQFDIKCDLDVIRYLYWIEKQQIIKKITSLTQSSQQTNLKRSLSSKDQNQEEDKDINLRKKVKILKKQ